MLPFVFAFPLLFPLFPALSCLWEPRRRIMWTHSMGSRKIRPGVLNFTLLRWAQLGFTVIIFKRLGEEVYLFYLLQLSVCRVLTTALRKKWDCLTARLPASFPPFSFSCCSSIFCLFISLRENDVNGVRSVCSSRSFNALPASARAEKSRPRRYR
jgi:hypothetical protein